MPCEPRGEAATAIAASKIARCSASSSTAAIHRVQLLNRARTRRVCVSSTTICICTWPPPPCHAKLEPRPSARSRCSSRSARATLLARLRPSAISHTTASLRHFAPPALCSRLDVPTTLCLRAPATTRFARRSSRARPRNCHPRICASIRPLRHLVSRWLRRAPGRSAHSLTQLQPHRYHSAVAQPIAAAPVAFPIDRHRDVPLASALACSVSRWTSRIPWFLCLDIRRLTALAGPHTLATLLNPLHHSAPAKLAPSSPSFLLGYWLVVDPGLSLD